MGTQYDNWLEKPYLDAADKEDAIEELCSEFLQEKNPNTFDGFFEGLCYAEIDNDDKQRITEYLKERDFDKLGRLLWVRAYSHWEDEAYKYAQEKFKQL